MSAARLAHLPPPKPTAITRATVATTKTVVQRKCAACEHEDSLQRRPRAGRGRGALGVPDRLAETAIQPKLRINAPGDRYEQEADRLADLALAGPPRFASPRFDALALHAPVSTLGLGVTPLQRRPTSDAVQRAESPDETPEEEGMVQTRRVTDGPQPSGEASATFERRVEAGRAGGEPMPRALRALMESRLGVDLGRVRLHTDADAARLAGSVDALAFTVGSHIWFGAGTFDPASDGGRRLIAHELVHTLQQEPAHIRPAVPAGSATGRGDAAATQNPASSTDLEANVAPGPSAIAVAEPGMVQRADTFVPENLPKGEDIHTEVLGAIAGDSRNADLFTEVRVPGASKSDVDASRTGRADLYMVEKGEKTTIAVNMDGAEPSAFSSHKDLRKGGAKFSHATLGAPKGVKKGAADCGVDAEGRTRKVCRLDQTPTLIRFGDLKPPAPVEILLGKGQIANYRKGVTNTANALNDFIDKNPTLAAPEKDALGQPLRWRLDTGTIGETDVKIPSSVAFGAGNKFPKVPLRLYRGQKRDDPIADLKGPISVYKDKEAGIWAYEWIPTEIPISVKSPKSSKAFKDAVERINDLIGDLTAPPEKTGMGRFGRRRPPPRADGPSEPIVQRKPGKRRFDPVEWPKQYGDWKTATKPLVDTPEGAVPRVTAAIVEVKERSKLPLPLPQSFDKTAKDYRKLERWSTWGSVFGRLRKAFGPLFVKFAAFYEKARAKFEELRKSKSESKPGSGLAGAIMKAAFKTASGFLRVIIQRVADTMKTALTTAGKVLFEEVFQDTFVERMIEAKTDVEAKIAEVEAEARGAVEDRIKEITGPYEKEITFISDVGKWLGDIGALVDAIKWGARIIQCLTPPGVGCLKLILQAVAEKALEMVIATCWFQRNFITPIFSKFSFFTELPGKISGFLIEKIKAMLPFDSALKDKMFPKHDIRTGLTNKDVECEEDKITKEQRELNKLFYFYGPAYVRDLIRLLEKGGVDEKKPISMADIERLRGLLEKMKKGELTKDQIKAALAAHDAKGFHNPAIDGVVDALKGGAGSGAQGGAGPGGGGGTPGAGGPPSQARRVAAKDAVASFTGGSQSDCAAIKVGGGSVDHKVGDKAKISLHGWAKGVYVGEIYDVPAIVSSVEDVEDAGKKQRAISYKIGQGVRFVQSVEGCGEFGFSAGREPRQTFDLAPAPAKGAP